MSWIAPSAADVQAAVAAPDYEVFTNSFLQGNQADPVPMLIAASVDTIRDAIRSGRRNDLGATGTIPSGAMETFQALVRFKLVSRLTSAPNYAKNTEVAQRQAQELLTSIRAGEVSFDQPLANNVTEVVSSGMAGSDEYVKVTPDDEPVVGDEP